MKGRYGSLVRCVVFLILLALTIYGIQDVFCHDSQPDYMKERYFLREKKDSLDAVYIGASDVYAFWQPLFGWNDHGIAVWIYSTPAMPAKAVKYCLIEAEKRQPNALFIISLSTFKKGSAEGSDVQIHNVVDYIPMSSNKLHMIDDLLEGLDYKGLDRLEFYLPIIRFHTRWDNMHSWVFDAAEEDYKCSSYGAGFMHNANDNSQGYEVFDTRSEIPDDVRAVTEDLLDYCDAHQLNVLFVKSPQNIGETEQSRMNTLQDLVEGRGYPCLDLLGKVDDMEIDLRLDYSDPRHTNVHGSLKYSKTLGDYLVENYHFEDKRGLEAWKSWDEAAERYSYEVLDRFTLPFEREHAPRVITDIPEITEIVAGEKRIELKWTEIEGIDGYQIYRKFDASQQRLWVEYADVGQDTVSFLDEGLDDGTTYYYAVVPYRLEDGEKVYGSFYARGAAAKTEGEKE